MAAKTSPEAMLIGISGYSKTLVIGMRVDGYAGCAGQLPVSP